MIEQLSCGAWVVSSDTHHKMWIEETGNLIHDPWFAEQVTRHIKPGDQAIDIGANIGTITRALLDCGAKVLAFEPNHDALGCLLENCPEAFVSVQGLSDERGVSGFVKDINAGASYVSKEGSQIVELNTLDEWVSYQPFLEPLNPRLIKIDAEGYEAKILRGGRKMIEKCKPVLILEVNRDALERAGDSEDILLSLVEELGYRWEIIQPGLRRGQPQYDIRCVPNYSYMNPPPLTDLKHRKDVGLWLNARGLTGTGAEIGVAYGENAEAILEKWNCEMLYLIDPWIQQPKEDYTDGDMGMNFENARIYCHGKLSRFKPRWLEVRLKSDDALGHVGNETLDFVYIDGSHQDPQVSRDVEQWWHKVKPGGLFGGHDYMDLNTPEYRCDVKRTVDRFVQTHNLPLHITDSDPCDLSWWIIKP